MSECSRAEALRDYAFDELAGGERAAMEAHLTGCAECAADLDALRVTAAALRALPDREIPQRIAFVSDKVFAPSPVARFFGSFWNSAARLGFLSACAIAAALVVSAYHRPKEIRTVETVTAAQTDVSKQVESAVAKAVERVREEDARNAKALLAKVQTERDHDRQAFLEMVTVLQNRANTNTLLARYDGAAGAGQ